MICAARGTSGSVPEGATLVRVDRDAPDGLAALRGSTFDAVVDTSIMSHRWVAEALEVLADSTAHWTFVSTASVYADQSKLGLTSGDEVLAPQAVHATLADRDAEPELYGAVKVAGEHAVRERFGERDFAAWIVDAAEHRLGGTYNAVGPSTALPEVLAGIASAVGADSEFVPVAPEVLAEHEVQPWAGPRSLPLWLPAGYHGMGAADVQPAVDAGLRMRSVADAAEGALRHERALGMHRERRAGLTPAEEQQVLAGVR